MGIVPAASVSRVIVSSFVLAIWPVMISPFFKRTLSGSSAMALAGMLDVRQMLRRQAIRVVIGRRMAPRGMEIQPVSDRITVLLFRLFAVPFAPRQLN